MISQRTFIIILFAAIVGIFFLGVWIGNFSKNCNHFQAKTFYNIPPFEIKNDTLSKENVFSEILKNEIRFSDIVLRQAILETGHFKSHNCLHRNNLFGMKGGENTPDNPEGYKIYDSWQESVTAYKEWQDKRWSDHYSDYYIFLESVCYAESPDYINKLKSIPLIIVKL